MTSSKVTHQNEEWFDLTSSIRMDLTHLEVQQIRVMQKQAAVNVKKLHTESNKNKESSL